MTAIEQSVIDELRERARDASTRAYAPYSNFPVGAAVLTDDGRIFTGVNVENAAFPLTVCAERNAIGAAVSAGHRTIRAVGVYTPTTRPTTPCGGCRQVINEFGPDAEIFSFCDSRESLHAPLAELLPRAFGPRNLEG
jgi:cytidine deaminase